jgi:hypothetical protein
MDDVFMFAREGGYYGVDLEWKEDRSEIDSWWPSALSTNISQSRFRRPKRNSVILVFYMPSLKFAGESIGLQALKHGSINGLVVYYKYDESLSNRTQDRIQSQVLQLQSGRYSMFPKPL